MTRGVLARRPRRQMMDLHSPEASVDNDSASEHVHSADEHNLSSLGRREFDVHWLIEWQLAPDIQAREHHRRTAGPVRDPHKCESCWSSGSEGHTGRLISLLA